MVSLGLPLRGVVPVQFNLLGEPSTTTTTTRTYAPPV